MASREVSAPGMSSDELLSDDLHTLLAAFPSVALSSLVGIVKQHHSWSPFPAPRAYHAHSLSGEADFIPHARAIAQEILWWGSNDLHRQLGEERGWREIVQRTAREVGVAREYLSDHLPAWRMEGAIVQKTMRDWENLSPEQREEVLRKAGLDFSATLGVATVAAGGLVRLGGQQLIAFLAARGTRACRQLSQQRAATM